MPNMTRRNSLPLVRLSLALPLLHALNDRGVTPTHALARLGLTVADLRNGDLFVTAPKMYELVEALAAISGDPYFGFRVGEQLDPFRWSPLRNAVSRSHTVGEVLLRFMEDAERDASSVDYTLTARGMHTTFREKRLVDGGITPSHNDGFTVAYLLTIIRRAMGEQWKDESVVIHVCDPEVIPVEGRRLRVAKQDTLGASITFPSAWLLASLAPQAARASRAENPPASPPSSMVDSFREAIAPHIDEFDMSLARAAEICGMSTRSLARRMKRNDTTVQKELDALRRSRAEHALLHGNEPIREIAASVGYADPTVFSRAFKRWTGVTPSVYRRSESGNDPEVS